MKNIGLLTSLLCLCAVPASANWQYPGDYPTSGYYTDDGSRFVLGFRAGASFGIASVNNDVGALDAAYYVNPDSGELIPQIVYENCTDCDGFDPVPSYVNIGDLPADSKFSSFSFTYGISAGWTIPNSPQWRMEIGWDHMAETEYNPTPLFAGNTELIGGAYNGTLAYIASGRAQSSVATDVFSVMAFYDFYDGLEKPLREFIPYIGFGVGYAASTTELQLYDLYGNLSSSPDLYAYGEPDGIGLLDFYKSEKDSSNVAGLLALGFSYGLDDGVFLDLGARVMYIPKITWALSNEDATSQRDWYSASNMIYANVMLGVRLEF